MADHQGTIRDLVDETGVQRKHVEFDSFGNVLSETHMGGGGPGYGWVVDQTFYFTGRLLDQHTGLQNNLHRWYDPMVGRWASEDPIGFAARDANIYRYVANMTTMAVDPNGLKVYWGVRDLDGVPIGNHGFIVIVPDDPSAFANDPNMVGLYDGKTGTTLGGHKSNTDCLVGIRNQKADIASVREHNDRDRYSKRANSDKYKSGWSYEEHEVKPPSGMSDTDFIRQLIDASENYNTHSPPAYTLPNANCHTWVNTLLKSAGVPESARNAAGEFGGIDWGEEDLIDESLFGPRQRVVPRRIPSP